MKTYFNNLVISSKQHRGRSYLQKGEKTLHSFFCSQHQQIDKKNTGIFLLIIFHELMIITLGRFCGRRKACRYVILPTGNLTHLKIRKT